VPVPVPVPLPVQSTVPSPVPSPAPAASAEESLAGLAARVRDVTPARIFTGRAGPTGYRTETQLALRADHAAARDAVAAPMELGQPPLAELAGAYGMFAVASCAADRREYLRRPDLGRRLSPTARERIAESCRRGADVQFVIGDGLSARAVAAQVPALLPLLVAGATERGWSVGRPFAVVNCRVGILNDVGDLLEPSAVVLLIGERPGLATAESLSAYLAWCPRAGHTDAQRNLVANIHARGIVPATAARRVLDFVAAMRVAGASGVTIKEPDGPALAAGQPPAAARLQPRPPGRVDVPPAAGSVEPAPARDV
jgi:ethanolamine ammonia-lyase small subunit